MRVEDATLLLDPGYLPFEEGTQRLPSGQLLVAARVVMPGVTGPMLDWWFGWMNDMELFRRWHPRDHLWMEWDERWRPGHYIGATQRLIQRMGDGPPVRLKVQFRDPAEYVDFARLDGSPISTIQCGRGGLLDMPDWDTEIVQVGRDTPWGLELRARYWLGAGMADGSTP